MFLPMVRLGVLLFFGTKRGNSFHPLTFALHIDLMSQKNCIAELPMARSAGHLVRPPHGLDARFGISHSHCRLRGRL
jgi:hypothetical protein